MGQQMTDDDERRRGTGDEDGADFSLGKYTVRTMNGSMVIAKSGRPKDALAV